jgi:hypothetical protein
MTIRVLSIVTAWVLAAISSGAAPPDPATLLAPPAHLASIRARVDRRDASLSAAMAALDRDARKARLLEPLSVMDKAIIPPSGDKHDYMSQAPYWWPDPATPNGRPYIRRDGERNPEIDRISDHDHLFRLTSAVSTLGLSYYLTRRATDAESAARLVRAWFLDPKSRMNPHLRYGQGIPGITEGRGIGIVETRVLPQLLDGVVLLAGSDAWTAADAAGLHAWMRAYLTWLLESQHGKDESQNGNNHETWYDVQVAALALYTNQEAVARRVLEGARARIAGQIEPDGRQPRELERTRSWHYSVFNLEPFFHLATLGERVGVDLWRYTSPDGRSLRVALDFLVPFASGDRTWTLPQITPFEPQAMHWLLRRAAAAWNEPRYRELAVRIGGSTPRLDLTTP